MEPGARGDMAWALMTGGGEGATIQGEGGYEYQELPGGEIRIVKEPTGRATGAILSRGEAFDAIKAEIAQKRAGGGEVRPGQRADASAAIGPAINAPAADGPEKGYNSTSTLTGDTYAGLFGNKTAFDREVPAAQPAPPSSGAPSNYSELAAAARPSNPRQVDFRPGMQKTQDAAQAKSDKEMKSAGPVRSHAELSKRAGAYDRAPKKDIRK